MVSIATVLVMSLSIFMIGSVILGGSFVSVFISSLEEKVDIGAYFNSTVPEREILAVAEELQKLPEVKSVKYISADEALANFKERHKDDKTTLQALEVVGQNPFSPNLEILAVNPSEYGAISKFLEADRFSPLLDVDENGEKKITYRQNQLAIDKLTSLLVTIRRVGLALSLVLALIALMVAHSTVRLAIYNSREEISVMQLVGASRAFIRGPFLVEGVIHGIISAIFTLAIFYPVFWFAGSKTENIFGGLNIFEYFLSNIFQIVLVLFVSGILLGALSATIAIRRYLRV